MRLLRGSVLAIALSVPLAACATADESAAPAADEGATAVPEAAAPTPAEEAPAPAGESGGGDVTEAFRAANAGAPWLPRLVAATQTEPERLVVETSIVDPRGDNGSPEAQEAIAACQAALLFLQEQGAADPAISVTEDDGTTFVLHNHSSVTEPCTEV